MCIRDSQRRVRYNGGARSALAPEGYLILSGVYHRELAEQLRVPIPQLDEYVSVRVVRTTASTGALIDGSYWRRAAPDATIYEPAPRIGD